MQFRNIMVYLDQGKSNQARVDSALAIASTHGAALTGVALIAQPSLAILQRLGVTNAPDLHEKSRADAQESVDQFHERAAAAGVEADVLKLECPEGDAAAKLSRVARVYDLSILRQANPDSDNTAFVAGLSEEVMFSSGRPVLYMPYIGAHQIPFKRGLIAWDGSRSSARAVHDALPLLENMDQVTILVINSNKTEPSSDGVMPGEGLSRHLHRHGISSEIQRLQRGDSSTSTLILNELANTGADLLVMGGYGTPKLREIILGGVTRTVLEMMTVPVFMSH
jgi:nucleotide-binding universal stress UspA family protein